MTYRICLVCLGNICRSPMAATVLRHRLDKAGLSDRVAVESAGTGSWHVGERADPRALAALREHGYEPSAHTGKQFRTDWFDTYDPTAAAEGDLSVPDPYYGGADGFSHVLTQIERAADGLVDALRKELRDR